MNRTYLLFDRKVSRLMPVLMMVAVLVGLLPGTLLAQDNACTTYMQWNHCPLVELFPEGPMVSVDFIVGSSPDDWPIVAVAAENSDECEDAETVGAMWDIPGLDMGATVTCDDEQGVSINDDQPTISWYDLSEETPCGGCPTGVSACTCMSYFCPSVYTPAIITDADIFLETSGLVAGAPPSAYSGTWDIEHTQRSLINHEIGASFNLADADEPLPHQIRTMTQGSSGHWSAGNGEHRVHPMQPDIFCLRQLYGPDSATEDQIDLTISNTRLDATEFPYETKWSRGVVNDSDDSQYVCPGDDVRYEYATYNRTIPSIYEFPINSPYDIDLYISTDTTLDTGADVLVKTDTIYSVQGLTDDVVDTFELPSGLALNTYFYVFAVVDPDDDWDELLESNNMLQLVGRVKTKTSCP